MPASKLRAKTYLPRLTDSTRLCKNKVETLQRGPSTVPGTDSATWFQAFCDA